VFFIDNGEKQKSRFVEELLWEQQLRDRTVESRPYVRAIQYKVNLSNRPPAAVAKTAEIVNLLRVRPFSASSLDAYLRCPLLFYYSRVLGLSKREEVTGEYERADIGTLVHSILAEFFLPLVGRQLLPSDLDRTRMATLVDRQFAATYGAWDTGAGRLLHAQIQEHLGRFLGDYMGPIVQETAVTMVAVEERLMTDWQGFRLTGRLDAVQSRGDVLFVIDYKTGHDAKNNRIDFKKLDPDRRGTWSGALGSLQLPVYLLLRGGTDQAVQLQGMFLMLGRTRLDRSIELPLFADQSQAAAELPRLQAVIRALLQEIVSPDVPFTPTEDRKRVCPTCDFNNICGTRWLAY
jgi:hypothetical protein